MGFPGGSVVKNLPANTGDMVSISALEELTEKDVTSHSSILAWEIHGQRSLAGYSPWSHKELDITNEQKQQGITVVF